MTKQPCIHATQQGMATVTHRDQEFWISRCTWECREILVSTKHPSGITETRTMKSLLEAWEMQLERLASQ